MIKRASVDDLDIVTNLASLLWSKNSYKDLKNEMREILLNNNAAIFLYLINSNPIGFIQCQLRFDYVEGTNSSPVGYLEAIYVDEQYRKKGIAKALLDQGQKWGKENECTEFASDCEIENMNSLKFHLKVGFTEVNRIICFRKKI